MEQFKLGTSLQLKNIKMVPPLLIWYTDQKKRWICLHFP